MPVVQPQVAAAEALASVVVASGTQASAAGTAFEGTAADTSGAAVETDRSPVGIASAAG